MEAAVARWIFEPGHTAAEFRARHMMVSWVRGHFKDVHGSLEFDPDRPGELAIETSIQVDKLWTGEPQRDQHLRSADFLDAAHHPTITFRTTSSTCVGASDYRVAGDLTIRGITKQVALDLHYLGKWPTPYWTASGNAGTVTRVGFVGQAQVNRQDFGVTWNGTLDNNGLVVSDEIHIKVDIEALLETELNALQVGGPG
jgi:polyisoprenoid-binding protein YceI